MERVAVVDDEAELERNAVLAHLAPQVLGGDGGQAVAGPAGPGGGGAQRGVERDVDVAGARQPRARVLPAPERDERAVAAADRAALQPVRPRALRKRAPASTSSSAIAGRRRLQLGQLGVGPGVRRAPRFFFSRLLVEHVVEDPAQHAARRCRAPPSNGSTGTR